jgi:hypothetical protein
MRTESRNHHYIPQFYLRAFGDGGGKSSKVTVLDLLMQRNFKTTPRNIASRRDFNRIEIDGYAPDELERQWAPFEAACAKAIREIETTHKFEGENKEYVLLLMALLASRSPEKREHIGAFRRQVFERMLAQALASKEHWDLMTTKEMQDKHPDVTYEEVKAFYETKRDTPDIPTWMHIHDESVMMHAIAGQLFRRTWMLALTKLPGEFFVTSDNPVVLEWIDPDKTSAPSVFQSPGFGLRGTRVYFALGPELALLGTFNERDCVVDASPALVGSFNSIIVQHAYRRVFTPKLAFPFVTGDGKHEYGNRIWSVFARPNGDKK